MNRWRLRRTLRRCARTLSRYAGRFLLFVFLIGLALWLVRLGEVDVEVWQ